MQRINPEIITQMRTWEVGAAAAAYDHRVRRLEHSAKADFTELGLLVKEVQERELWRYIASETTGEMCNSFDLWLHESLPFSASWAYEALGVAKDCDDIPAHQRSETWPGNLITLRAVSPHIRRDPQIQERAKTTKPQQFVRELAAEHPNEHLEGKSPMRFNPTAGQRVVYEGALELCSQLEETTTREESLEKVCQSYIEENAFQLGTQKQVGKITKRHAAVQ